ncbi:MAG: putative DCC family thiol-disulfide oxidoreductase YuxK [Paracoccaceae bacterium]|jgi:predicted DCC family thiol-disulfide oxidoreductase YuxK
MNDTGQPFSYRSDENVPSFDDTFAVAVIDGECALCTFGARKIDRFDKARKMRICPVQSPLGRALLIHYKMDPTDPESWIFLENGIAWTSFDAWIKAGETVGGIGNLMRLFWIVPRSFRDWIYRRIARNRIAVFGKADLCSLPSPSFRARLIGDE